MSQDKLDQLFNRIKNDSNDFNTTDLREDKLDQLLNSMKNETINFNAIDAKTEFLINKTPSYYISPKIPLMTAMILLFVASTLGTFVVYNNNQQMIALQKLEQERANALNSNYIYTTLISNYQQEQ